MLSHFKCVPSAAFAVGVAAVNNEGKEVEREREREQHKIRGIELVKELETMRNAQLWFGIRRVRSQHEQINKCNNKLKKAKINVIIF